MNTLAILFLVRVTKCSLIKLVSVETARIIILRLDYHLKFYTILTTSLLLYKLLVLKPI